VIVHQVVRDRAGVTLADAVVTHVYRFNDGLVAGTWSSPIGAILRDLLAAAADDAQLHARTGISAMGTAWLAKLERGRASSAARLSRVLDVIGIG
jgi:hypothetical protein